jgi:hypothetical protein
LTILSFVKEQATMQVMHRVQSVSFPAPVLPFIVFIFHLEFRFSNAIFVLHILGAFKDKTVAWLIRPFQLVSDPVPKMGKY